MNEPAPEHAPRSRYDPDKVAGASFDVVRRGFNEGQVRQFLRDLAGSLRAAYRTEDKLRASIADLDAKLVDASMVDEHLLTERLGAEAAAILNTARESASTRLADAQAEAERLATTSSDEAQAILDAARDDAEQMTSESRQRAEALVAEAEARAEELLADAEGVLDKKTAEADAEAARRLAAVANEVAERRSEGEQVIAEAKQQGRILLIEAQRHREQLLHNLEQRRRRMRDQIERLQAGRDRLLEAYEVVQHTIDTARHDLKVALPEAKMAGDRVSRHLDEQLPASIDSLESELDEARRAGLLGNPDDIAADAAAAGGVELPLGRQILLPAEVTPTPAGETAVSEIESELPPTEAEPESELLEEAGSKGQAEATIRVPVDRAPAVEVDEPSAVAEAASLFERLRAEREAQVSAAQVVLADADTQVDIEADHEMDDAVGDEQASIEPSVTSRAHDLVVARHDAIDASVAKAAKQAKRILGDLQNAVLAELRGGPVTSVELNGLEAAVTAPLADAWAAGAAAVGRPGDPVDARTQRVRDALDAELFAPMRRELIAAVTDDSDAVEAVRVVFRRVRPRLVDVIGSATASAFLDGMLDTLPEGCPVRWVPGDGPDDAKHAAINGSVEIRLGSMFPTGDIRPAPLGGCRCLIVPLHA